MHVDVALGCHADACFTVDVNKSIGTNFNPACASGVDDIDKPFVVVHHNHITAGSSHAIHFVYAAGVSIIHKETVTARGVKSKHLGRRFSQTAGCNGLAAFCIIGQSLSIKSGCSAVFGSGYVLHISVGCTLIGKYIKVAFVVARYSTM